jgi:hypothetical protein
MIDGLGLRRALHFSISAFQHSAFSIQHSAFSIQHSAFSIQHFSISAGSETRACLVKSTVQGRV